VIPEKNANTVTSTVQGDAIAMSIDSAAMGHIMNVLTNLYSDEELACIREYATNAFDAHVEIGQTRPIEVTLPTDLRPILSIRDYGPGLSANDIETIYSQYGASSKRGSNDAVGMLGLGCKSALAYVDQFTLVSVKDGERITVSVARDENGAGVMTINSREETGDDPGVEVLIPVKRFNEFERKAAEFFRYWEPGTVLVNGEEPAPIEGWKIDNEFTIIDAPDSYDRKLRVVMGNVSYPVSWEYEHESDILKSLPNGKQIIARVPIGMVSFTPSREALQEHPATKAALDQILATFTSACSHAIRNQIALAADKPAAAKALIAARVALGAKNVPAVTYGGQIVPTVISAEDLTPAGSSLWRNSPGGGMRGSASHRTPAGQVSLDDAAKNPWIVNYTNANWSKTQRHKLNRYMEEHNLLPEDVPPGRRSIFITNAPAVPMPDWIDGNVLAIDWGAVREWKDPKTASEGGSKSLKYAGTYPTWRYSSERGKTVFRRTFAADELPKSGRDLYYCHMGGGRLQALLGERAVVVEVPDYREAKFLRLFPHARDAHTVMQKAAAAWWAKLDDEAALAIAVAKEAELDADLTRLRPGAIDDPQLSEVLTAWRRYHGDNKLRNNYGRFSDYLNIADECDIVAEECYRITARYNLIAHLYSSRSKEYRKHLILYINAVYAAEKR
jgi:hypothetical protein